MFNNLFNKEIKRVFNESFQKLPNIPPYGFWITPSGDFETVMDYQGHDDSAADIIKKSPRLLKYAYDNKINPDGDHPPFEEFMKQPNAADKIANTVYNNYEATEVLLINKYGRVVKNSGKFILNVFDMYYGDPVIERVKKTTKDIADFYNYGYMFATKGSTRLEGVEYEEIC